MGLNRSLGSAPIGSQPVVLLRGWLSLKLFVRLQPSRAL
jgi:hypothetical protein